MKYILFEDFSRQPIPVLFPDRIAHDEMREQMPYGTVLSAGYVNHGPNGFVCHGESKALQVGAAQDDATTIAKHFQQGQD